MWSDVAGKTQNVHFSPQPFQCLAWTIRGAELEGCPHKSLSAACAPMACLRKRSVGSSGALATRLGESANSWIQRGPVEVQIRRLQMRRGRQQHYLNMFTNDMFLFLVRKTARIAWMTWQKVATWRWKKTRQVRLLGSRRCNSSCMHSTAVKWTGVENFAKFVTLNFTCKACMCGQDPEIFGAKRLEAVTGLPRLYSKQAPARGWEAVQVPRWVQKQLEAEKAETTKRPKTHSKRGSKELCAGFSPGFPSLFSKTNIGGPARTDDERKCMFCDPEKMRKACETAKGRGSVVRSLKAFKACI